MAAEQIGDIQRNSASNANVLLAKMLPLLHSRKWEVRTAGGFAVEAIAASGELRAQSLADDFRFILADSRVHQSDLVSKMMMVMGSQHT
eukprot:SAG31_NODE_1734_length_7416_cov_2.201449_4_plen_89_part_00